MKFIATLALLLASGHSIDARISNPEKSDALDHVDENGIDHGDEIGIEGGMEDETRHGRALAGFWEVPTRFRDDVPAGGGSFYYDLGVAIGQNSGACRYNSYPAYRVRVQNNLKCAQRCEDDPKCVAIEYRPGIEYPECGCASRFCNNCEIFHDLPTWVEDLGSNDCMQPLYVCMVREISSTLPYSP